MRTLLALLLMVSVAQATTGDVNGDGKVGLEETIYSLQVTAGMGPQPSTGHGAVEVYDANDQYLGVLLSLNEQAASGYFTVFNTEMNLAMALNKKTGLLLTVNSYFSGSRFYYADSQCRGNPPYAMGVGPDNYSGYLVGSPSFLSGAPPYMAFNVPTIALPPGSASSKYMTDSSCTDFEGSLPDGVLAIKYYAATELPITLPVAFPLRFTTSN